MGSAIPRGELAEIVRAARGRTHVPSVSAAVSADGAVVLVADGLLTLGGGEPTLPAIPLRRAGSPALPRVAA